MNKIKTIIKDLNETNWMKDLQKNASVFIVGGSVRDSFIGKTIKDIDLIVEGLSYNQIQNILKKFGKVQVHGESFSVLVFKPKGHKGEPFEIAIPRMDRKIGDGHKGFEINTENVDLKTDLKRRDFTINSIAINIKNNEIIDPFNGLTDIENKLLRATDKNAFIEDPLRILRGIQFSSRFKFDIELETFELMKQNSHLIKEISGERIFDELMKILNKLGDTELAIKLISDTGIDKALFGNKIPDFKCPSDLDPISFFWVLSQLGGVNPGKFLKERLKADNNLINSVITLELLLIMSNRDMGEEDFKFMIFKALQRDPDVITAKLLPMSVFEVVQDMEKDNIPKTMNDIAINGDDIKDLGIKEGPEVGFLKEMIIRDSLMNKFNWKNKKDSLKYLKNIFEKNN